MVPATGNRYFFWSTIFFSGLSASGLFSGLSFKKRFSNKRKTIFLLVEIIFIHFSVYLVNESCTSVLPIKWKPIFKGIFRSWLWKPTFCGNNFLPYSKVFLLVKLVFPLSRNLNFKEIFITLSENWFSGLWKPFLSVSA